MSTNSHFSSTDFSQPYTTTSLAHLVPIEPSQINLERAQQVLQSVELSATNARTNEKIFNDASRFIESLKWIKEVRVGQYVYTKGPIYLAGPMSGYAEHNFPLFNETAEILRQDGWYVLNPAENFGGDASQSYETHYLADIKLVELCTDIAFLPDWQKSGGAVGEFMLGDRLNKQLHAITPGSALLNPLKVSNVVFTPFVHNQLPEETVLEEADRLVATDRQGQYGHPFEDFSRTAALWTGAGFSFRGREVRAEEIAIAMMLLKISRIVNMPKRDSIVDAAGYAKTLDLVIKKREELKKE